MSAPTATATPQSLLDSLFPVPKKGTTLDGTTLHPGVTDEGGKALVKLLKDDYERHHIFFNDRGFHNHSTHHLYAIWTLGAQASLLDAAYQTHVVYQRPSFDSPKAITDANWKDHLHDEKYYRAYLKFFSEAVSANGVSATLEKFVFTPEANIVPGLADEKQPKMLNRFMSGLLHPFIHAGYAAEFGTPGMMAEGLAMAALTETGSDHVIPDELFANSATSTLSKLTSALSLSSGPTTTTGTNAYTLLAKIAEDPALAPGTVFKTKDFRATFGETIQNGGKLIWKYAEEWAIDGESEEDINVKLEELSWIATIVYGIGGLQVGQEFKANFVYMHLVTSSLFTHSFVKILSPKSKVLLLRTYLSVTFLVWVALGRPTIDIKNFYANTNPIPQPPKSSSDSNSTPAKPDDETLDPQNLTPNSWLPILQTTLQHPNEHLPKFQRALSLYSTWYGTTQKGYFKERAAVLKGAEELDGTLFVRVAGLTADALGWVREGQKKGEWVFNLFLKD